jgi:hypothetical protein
VRRVLSDPTVVLAELEQPRDPGSEEAISQLEREIASVADREKRLVRLFTFGEIDDEVVREEGGNLRRRRAVLEERLRALQHRAVPPGGGVDPNMLTEVCSAVAAWLERAGPAERVQVLEALQVAIVATADAATLTGVLPVEVPQLSGIEYHPNAGGRTLDRGTDEAPFQVTLLLSTRPTSVVCEMG